MAQVRATAHHTAYRVSPMGRLESALEEARQGDWLVVDMQADWKRVFAFE